DDAERERRRERGVDRVAAGAQRHETGLRRQGVVRRDSAAPPDDQGPITADVLVHAGSLGWPNHRTLPQRPLWARKGRDGSETAEAPSRPLHTHSDSCVAALVSGDRTWVGAGERKSDTRSTRGVGSTDV